jgi:transposase
MQKDYFRAFALEALGRASNLVDWAGMRPRNDESAGKIQSRKILHGNKYLRQILVEISWCAARSNKSFLGRKYNARRGKYLNRSIE